MATRPLVLAAAILTLSLQQPALGCTTVAVPHSSLKLVGKSYDWHSGLAMVVVNKRHVKKTGLALRPTDQPPAWTSRYGSLTFNQYGREFPNGGINEKGLVVELMWLDSSVYPQPGAAPSLNELQWIQYHLDRYATVQEMVTAASSLSISKVYAAVHYLACDAGGACATFEYIGGQLVVHTGPELPRPALTNNTYADSLSYLQSYETSSDGAQLPQGPGSLARFARAATAATAYREAAEKPSFDYMFQILSGVHQDDYTKWNIVYSSANGHVSFRTEASPEVKAVAAFTLDYDCRHPVRILDMNAQLPAYSATDVSKAMATYSEMANRLLIEAGLRELKVQFPSAVLERWVHYPETTTCMD